jgi:acyl-CoA synthetase (AMP-forming)/AMP-acid ligase II
VSGRCLGEAGLEDGAKYVPRAGRLADSEEVAADGEALGEVLMRGNSGENIPTIEVEQAISEHPAVAAVAVVSTPDEKWGERPKAFVELADGEEASEDEILDFAKERLTGYMLPSSVEITELPKTSTGKIQTKELRDKEWEGPYRRIG